MKGNDLKKDDKICEDARGKGSTEGSMTVKKGVKKAPKPDKNRGKKGAPDTKNKIRDHLQCKREA